MGHDLPHAFPRSLPPSSQPSMLPPKPLSSPPSPRGNRKRNSAIALYRSKRNYSHLTEKPYRAVPRCVPARHRPPPSFFPAPRAPARPRARRAHLPRAALIIPPFSPWISV